MYINGRKPIPQDLIVALIYSKDKVLQLVELNADLGIVPSKKFPQKKSRTGNSYYVVDFQVEVTYFSAYTKYELIHDNINYGAVSAEYV